MSRKVLLVGCGYIGEQVALRELAAGASVSAIVKTEVSAAKLSSKGVTTFVLDLDERCAPQSVLIADYDVIYYLLPPQSSGEQDLRVQQFLSLRCNESITTKFVLISTTGVYGDCAGQWIDETREPRPVVARAHRRLSAEQQCRSWSLRVNSVLVILRVGGIYGAGKLPLQRLERGDPVLKVKLSPWSNRIYSKDLIEVCYRAAVSNIDGVLNAVDGNPSTMTEYFLQVADFAGLDHPTQISMEEAGQQLGKGIMSYLSESRRIGNNRLIQDLGADCIRFPTLDQGLADIKLSKD